MLHLKNSLQTIILFIISAKKEKLILPITKSYVLLHNIYCLKKNDIYLKHVFLIIVGICDNFFSVLNFTHD